MDSVLQLKGVAELLHSLSIFLENVFTFVPEGSTLKVFLSVKYIDVVNIGFILRQESTLQEKQQDTLEYLFNNLHEAIIEANLLTGVETVDQKIRFMWQAGPRLEWKDNQITPCFEYKGQKLYLQSFQVQH